ncbi:peptidoglycan-binding protein [Salipaludibacillus sp. HK11]|uniref:peptidoglycan-binding protein n=1 Tax=Salipaludibacillus sp. HK11 TaxID=3394320 RepID=UPI0039FDC136
MNLILRTAFIGIVMILIPFVTLPFGGASVSYASGGSFGDNILSSGYEHSHVEELQDLLKQRNYLDESLIESKGTYDQFTHEAVLAFQKEANIHIDGVAGLQTIGALLILREGDNGKLVENLQQDLNHLGYYKGSLDGKFDQTTHDAVKKFQSSSDILVDGLAGPQTYGSLHEAIHKQGIVSSSEGSGQIDTSTDSTSENSETPENNTIENDKSDESKEDKEPDETSNSNESKPQVTEQEESSPPSSGTSMTVEATAYTAYCDGCSGITYTGLDLRNNPNKKVIAVDPNVIPLGSKVYVEGYGNAVAGDIGGAIKGHKVDLFMPDREDALAFGRRNIEITIIE